MRIKIMYMAIMGTMIINTMEIQKFVWQVKEVHHFGGAADYDDFQLFGDCAGNGFKLRLYGTKHGYKRMYLLNLFNGERPIMQFAPKVLPHKSTEYISCDGNWRVTVARRSLAEGEYEVVSQYRCRFSHAQEEQESCKNICTALTAWMRSWSKKETTATS